MKRLFIALVLAAALSAQSLSAAATTFLEKKNVAYVWLANAIASESPSTTDHDKRLAIAKQCATLNPSFDAYVTIDMTLSEGYNDSTPQNTINNRLSALVTNLIALGF